MIPLPMSNCAYHLQYLIPLYFLFAVGYDIWMSAYDLIAEEVEHVYWEQEHEHDIDVHPTGILTVVNTTYFNGTL